MTQYRLMTGSAAVSVGGLPQSRTSRVLTTRSEIVQSLTKGVLHRNKCLTTDAACRLIKVNKSQKTA
ncbi:hypothetical protein pipiens_017846 [Culex pipiens pipiens]|uniref:Uncharacterized protein n=1 Tax=Culex pipiens pipiens TaxID=38569 RepID=A0ABD1CES7_CULPP